MACPRHSFFGGQMTTIDSVTLLVAILLAVFGAALGFGRTLRIFTKGIFGIIISVFLCVTFGGMIAGIPAVADWIAELGNGWGVLATVLYYIVLFFVMTLLRILVVRLIGTAFAAPVLPVRILNRVLGAVMAVGGTLLFVLLVFGVLRIFGETSFVQDLASKMEGSFLGLLYENNPVKFV